ncbi:energy-converting hydrogenase subunit EhaL family protein [Methanobrevibacter woesei]|jgi:energy-converting hydrogenase A subunit L|uniref:energy-converting hydrogenase subunit EhaL family protein n=1 Tax=Methanobrevibacter woesei TaxID=190976 RepID=UPI002356D529|nr:energy-converting hydrogenase subunit EhaL family protein [Methanobrevibacter woesei]
MIEYLIYILTFVIGSILGLLWSYKKHGEPYVIKGLDIAITVIALIGWILIFNFTWSVILLAIGFFLVGFVLNERPGYGRLETVIGIIVSAVIYLIWHLILMV